MKKITLILLAFQFYSNSGIAQWSGDPSVADTKVIVRNSQQHGAHIISDGSGGSIIFWIDERNSPAYDIYYNRLNSAGVAVWATTSEGIRMTDNFSDYNDINQVISDENGGAFIIWDNGGQLWVQHIDNTGAKVWPYNYLIGDGEDGFLCSDGEGGFIFTWSSYIGNDEFQTYAQRIDENGNTAWYAPGYDGVPVIVSAGSRKPMGIVTDGDGGAIIAMEDARNSSDEPDNLDIFAQKIDRYGNTVWGLGGVPVCTASGNQSRYGTQASYIDYESYGQGQQHPCIVSDGAGGAIIAWEDYRDDPNNGNTELDNEGDIYCQRINQDGETQWYTYGNNLCDENGDQYAVSLMPNGSGGAVAAWVDRRYGGSYLYAQNISSSGNVQWTPGGNQLADDVDWPSYTISPDASNSAMLATWVATIGCCDLEIRSQKIEVFDGTLAWGENGIVVCSTDGNKSEPVITYAGNSDAIIAWTDERNSGTTNLDIYANMVISGALPVTLITFNAELKNSNVLLQWATSSEQNTSHFEIEHSIDGTHFSKIGNVQAAGKSASKKDYVFSDQHTVNGINFYRLKIVDADERFVYSRTARVSIFAGMTLQLFPNPATDVLNLRSNQEMGNGMIQIFDVSGKKVKEQRISISKNSPIAIDISHLSKGIYHLNFTSQRNTKQIKFVKQ